MIESATEALPPVTIMSTVAPSPVGIATTVALSPVGIATTVALSPVGIATTVALSPITTPAERAVSAAAAVVAPITLEQLNALAELQTRVDRKYFVPAGTFRRLIAVLADEMQVLEIKGRRTFGYESIYFDTPELITYRAHLQRRRQRFKARTRTYTDSGLCMFEVKLSGMRGETVKERVPHPTHYGAQLTADAVAHLRTTLGVAFRQDLPLGLQPTLATTYQRTTFVSRTGECRLTCDVDLVCRNSRHEVLGTGTHVLVESKSSGPGSAPDRILRELGVRPAAVSKYCVAIAALHPDLPSNPWRQTLQRYFEPRAVRHRGARAPHLVPHRCRDYCDCSTPPGRGPLQAFR